ncbi:MAG TPA: AAA domain-containing protein [Nitrososphaeraceae archaeon]|nr:AAA domain-containing protein [Nitrososphaeraceae archaeon]
MTINSSDSSDDTEEFHHGEQEKNFEQIDAVERIKNEGVVPITGPPGTGKSTVISQSCFNLITDYSPVLIVSPTNAMINSILVKIDNLAKQANLQLPRGFIIRYGNLSELSSTHPHLRKQYSLDDLVQEQCCPFSSYSIDKIAAGRDYLQNARIILCTDYSAKDLGNIVQAGAVLIDEAGLVRLDRMGMLFSSVRDNNGKIIVIGDDKQLPPPSHDYIASSIFRSILDNFKTTLLRTEYRFNQDILDLINPYYENKLAAHNSVKDISTADICKKEYHDTNNNVRRIVKHENKVVFVDTDGYSREQMHFVNTGEVFMIKDIVDGYFCMGINNIIVTTPYKQQERMLQLNLQKGLRIGTIDKFQGQEDEVTIISMVRSNNNMDYQQSLGFVNIPRSCVAFSRSKRKTIIVGDRDTLIKNRFLSKSIDTIIRKDGFLIWRDSDS